ncbi:MAG: hypothetical protein R3F03_09540 [Opitutaceae bacterium]
MSSPSVNLPPPSLLHRFRHVPLFLLLFFAALTYPLMPSVNLDASWRMALGKFLMDGKQFGTEVVFTYGPLGFLMGKTYYGSGFLYQAMLTWQFFAAFVFAAIIMYWGQRLAGGRRIFYYAFFLIFGLTYDDAMQMLMIVLMGMDLVRRSSRGHDWISIGMLLLLSFMSAIKFTNLVLALVVVLISAGHLLLRRDTRNAFVTLLVYVGGFITVWCLCRQNPLNLPAYFKNSWIISQGYQQVMGIATPIAPLWKGLASAALILTYLVINLWLQRDKLKALAYTGMLGAFLYLNWKHGFVRSDGHMVGYFFCALLPVVLFPVLLEDEHKAFRPKQWLLIPAGLLCVLGIRDTLPGMVDYGLGIFQTRLWTNVGNTFQIGSLRETYDAKLGHERQGHELFRTRDAIGDASVDVMGYDQVPALYTKLNYQPRPVFQSYSAYTTELARLNAAHYASDAAPDYVLIRMNSIDERLPAMDDSAALYTIAHRYRYVLTEKSFQLWKRNAEAFDAAAVAPRPLVRRTLPVGESWLLEEYAGRSLWLEVDLRPTLLGRLRAFLYKPPMLRIETQDMSGNISRFRMPAPIGQAGFIISPLIQDLMGYVNFAAGQPERLTRRITIELAEADRKYFQSAAMVTLSELAPPSGGKDFFAILNKERFHMFESVPESFDSQAPPSEETIDRQTVIVMHAPSELTFDVPAGATTITGMHGFIPGAYTGDGHSNGADFRIVWSDGTQSIDLYHKFLDPGKEASDRGLIPFKVSLGKLERGRLYFRIGPGPFNDHSWDWTAWTKIKIE